MRHFVLLSLVAAACGGGSRTQTTQSGPAPGLEPPPDPAPVVAPKPARPEVAVGKPSNDLIPRAVIFGNPERAGAQLSPDGKHLSWLAPKDGVMNIWVAAIGAGGKVGEARAITAEKTRPLRQYFWAYTGKHLVYLQDVGGDENFHAYRVDLAGKTQDLTPYKGARAELQNALNPKFPTKLVVHLNDRNPQVFDVHEVDLLTGKRRLLVQNDDNFTSFVLDNTNRVRFASKKLPDGGTQLFVRDGKGWKPWETLSFEDAEATGIAAFAPGDKAVYMGESRGRDTTAIVQLDVATKKSRVLAEDAKSDAGEIVMHPRTRALQAVQFEYDRTRWQVVDKAIQKDVDALDAMAKADGGTFEIVSRTTNDKQWLVRIDSAQKPGRFHLWERGKQKATFLFSVRPELEKQPLVKMWPVEIKSRDGLTLVSYLSLPTSADPDGDGKANAPVPMVLFVHGGPWARDSLGYHPGHQMLANRGYAVLSVNYRGSSGFGKKFMNAGNLQWGKQMHDDLIDAVDWAVKNNIAPKDRICIGGGSYGGYATLVGMTMTPDTFRCGVDIVGVSNIETFIKSIPPYWAPFLALLRMRVGDPETPEGKAALAAVSPVTHAAKIRRPLLIGQGANDPRVKQAESEQIVAAMKQHDLPVTYVVFPDEGHGFARPENNIAFFAITEAFLSAHLGGFYQPITKAELEASSMQIKDGKEGIPGLTEIAGAKP